VDDKEHYDTYFHPSFKRGRHDLLSCIVRNVPQTSQGRSSQLSKKSSVTKHSKSSNATPKGRSIVPGVVRKSHRVPRTTRNLNAKYDYSAEESGESDSESHIEHDHEAHETSASSPLSVDRIHVKAESLRGSIAEMERRLQAANALLASQATTIDMLRQELKSKAEELAFVKAQSHPNPIKLQALPYAHVQSPISPASSSDRTIDSVIDDFLPEWMLHEANMMFL
jgi:hypothetical protein